MTVVYLNLPSKLISCFSCAIQKPTIGKASIGSVYLPIGDLKMLQVFIYRIYRYMCMYLFTCVLRSDSYRNSHIYTYSLYLLHSMAIKILYSYLKRSLRIRKGISFHLDDIHNYIWLCRPTQPKQEYVVYRPTYYI